MTCAMCGGWMAIGTLIGALIVVLLIVLIWRVSSGSRQ